MTAISANVYTFEELNVDAQRRVFLTWATSPDMDALREMEEEEISSAVRAACDLLGSEIDRYNYFTGATFDDAIQCADGIDEYAGSGTAYGWDIAEAFNAHVPELQHLRDICERQNYSDASKAEYVAEYDSALWDVGKVIDRAYDAAFDYYQLDGGALEIWNDGYASWYTEGRWYLADGKDVTDFVAALNIA